MEHIITKEQRKEFEQYLRREEKAENTIAKYLHDFQCFSDWIGEASLSKERIALYKEELLKSGKVAVTVNAALAAIHSFLEFSGWMECRVKYLKIQRKVFRDSSRDLSKEEYMRLVNTAVKRGNERLALIMETICATGIRVSEVKYITAEAVKKGRTEIALKGKIRTILIPSKLGKKLQKYARKQKIASGELFLTKSGQSFSRRQIWAEMKKLCEKTGINKKKVFPHNLRHLFAQVYYKSSHDIVQLADVLGHSSIETTRIYLISTGAEHVRQLNRLGFVV